MSMFKKYDVDSVLTLEAAQTQIDSGFIGDMVNHISMLRDYITKNGINENSRPENDVEFKKILEKINMTLTSRFGLTFKLILNKNQLLGTYIVTPPEQNVLVGAVDDYYKFLGKNFSTKPNTGSNDVGNDEVSLYNTLYNNYKSLKNKLDTSNIIIDLKEAKITNAPTNLIVFIYLCPSKLFSDEYGLTDNEIIACILHEVGHNFAVIENSYRHVINTSVILNSIHETIRVKNGSPLDAIKLSYKRLTGEELKTDSVINAAVALKNKYTSVAMNGDDNFVLTSTDNESLADQFTSRFLLGDKLASTLTKLGPVDRPLTSIELMSMSFKENMVINTILIIILLPLLGISLPFLLFVMLVASSLDLRQFNTTGRIYDQFSRRLLKIKQDAIRQMRLLKESGIENEQTIKKLVNIVDNIDRTMLLQKDNKMAITKFLGLFEFSKDSKNLISFNDSTNNLIENNLHYISEKI